MKIDGDTYQFSWMDGDILYSGVHSSNANNSGTDYENWALLEARQDPPPPSGTVISIQ